ARLEAEGELLRSMGYELAERYCRMRVWLEEPPPEPQWPHGVRVRTAVRGEDERRAYEVIEDANSDDPRHEPMEYSSWLRLMVDTYRYDPSLWWLVREGEEIVGAALGVEFADEGWIRLVGVRREWRRRGIATALLRTAFSEFWRRGYRRVELGVDPDSPFGAQEIYARSGMHVAFELVKYQRELPCP
ncbi:MAG: GNAT family N-acetyltransferase, partial [Chloroflexota bacterium]|nr:GNAT family N-acetyltransferase [Chloroflexota bacterium]